MKHNWTDERKTKWVNVNDQRNHSQTVYKLQVKPHYRTIHYKTLPFIAKLPIHPNTKADWGTNQCQDETVYWV